MNRLPRIARWTLNALAVHALACWTSVIVLFHEPYTAANIPINILFLVLAPIGTPVMLLVDMVLAILAALFTHYGPSIADCIELWFCYLVPLAVWGVIWASSLWVLRRIPSLRHPIPNT